MTCRGIRGAVCVETNDAAAIIAATREMLERIVADNDVVVDDIACVIFTATPDLDTAYPARAARELGWMTTPLLCEQEMVVKGGMGLCIRALVLWNTDLPVDEIRHVYLGHPSQIDPFSRVEHAGEHELAARIRACQFDFSRKGLQSVDGCPVGNSLVGLRGQRAGGQVCAAQVYGVAAAVRASGGAGHGLLSVAAEPREGQRSAADLLVHGVHRVACRAAERGQQPG